jgi:hypothetical protein
MKNEFYQFKRLLTHAHIDRVSRVKGQTLCVNTLLILRVPLELRKEYIYNEHIEHILQPKSKKECFSFGVLFKCSLRIQRACLQ